MDDSGPPCRRCAERNLGCVLGKNLQSIIDEKSQYTDAVLHDLDALHATLRDVTQKLGLSEPQPLETSGMRDAAGSSPISPEDESHLPNVPIHSLYALTKLRALRPDSPDEHRSRLADDFIARGAISLTTAERLFCLYRDELDFYIYRVGCRYQTLDELRRKSSVLTAATLTVAALHEPAAEALYGVCSAEFRRLMEKSMFDRRVDRDYIRAMAVAAYWLSDMSWMISGYAIRRASECNLHNCHSQAIEKQSQEAADGARLWYILNICDQHLATLYGRPAIVHEDSSMQGWESFLESPVSNAEDKRLASQVALLGILGSIRELFGPDKGQPIPRAYLHQIAHFNKQLDHWIGHWSGVLRDQYSGLGRFPSKGALLHFHFAKLHLYSHIFRGSSGENPIPHYFLDGTATAIAAATSTIEFILTDPDVSASVVGLPSYLHCMTAFACMFLIKVSVKHGGDLIEPQRVWDLTTRLVRHFRSLPTGRWHLANLMAPGLEKMAATLKPHVQGQAMMQNGMAGCEMTSGVLDASGQPMMPVADPSLMGMEGDILFDFDMSFGLSPVFRFDAATMGIEGLQEFANVEYSTQPQA
ncbi:Non-classical export protein 2 [Verticillium dahliae VDG2]|nr:Non-classical export protein 2 [Verticillium dahliae VDG2]